jgi:hypothetical protein
MMKHNLRGRHVRGPTAYAPVGRAFYYIAVRSRGQARRECCGPCGIHVVDSHEAERACQAHIREQAVLPRLNEEGVVVTSYRGQMRSAGTTAQPSRRVGRRLRYSGIRPYRQWRASGAGKTCIFTSIIIHLWQLSSQSVTLPPGYIDCVPAGSRS